MIEETLSRQKEYFYSGATLPLSARLSALDNLEKSVRKREEEVIDALHQDLNKSRTEAIITELGIFYNEITYLKKNLKKLMKPEKIRTTLSLLPARSYIVSEPYGCVLIMSPWNYPFLLTMQPLSGALAGGNCATLKPSAYSPHTSEIIRTIVSEALSEELVSVVLGGRQENQQLLDQPFDFIFFTGSVAVGKLVMNKASERLTPITLELGGKSPVIVDETADIDLAAKRLVFGKFINAGQTCVAPDHVFVHQSVEQQLIDRLIYWIEQFYPLDDKEFIADYPRIINQKHFERLLGLLKDQQITYGGKYNEEASQIQPTIIRNVSRDNKLMQEELFGPIFPILSYERFEEVVSEIKRLPKPLALYLFSTDENHMRVVENEISFGGGCINDCVVQLSNHHLPFGGVGNSGVGSYHGKASFRCFTHQKSLVRKSNHLDIAVRYRPYDKRKNDILTRL
ncbi:MAG: aldehyde dehydrogenase family protein [Erysipelotrichaceae bacterium]|nr:aldehyde dehydrogenase family protein [Erysipelotrichaceae bacterium]